MRISKLEFETSYPTDDTIAFALVWCADTSVDSAPRSETVRPLVRPTPVIYV